MNTFVDALTSDLAPAYSQAGSLTHYLSELNLREFQKLFGNSAIAGMVVGNDFGELTKTETGWVTRFFCTGLQLTLVRETIGTAWTSVSIFHNDEFIAKETSRGNGSDGLETVRLDLLAKLIFKGYLHKSENFLATALPQDTPIFLLPRDPMCPQFGPRSGSKPDFLN